jgi:hypothetical protein
VTRDLQRVLGEESAPDDVPVFCGGGDRTECAELLWDSLRAARSEAGPWPALAAFQRIRFLPYIGNLQSMRWSNRPTFQQVVSFDAG